MKVAVCEAGPIDALGDAGSRSVFDLIEATRTLGHDVLVVDESEAGAFEALAIWAPDVVVVSRPGLFSRAYSALSRLGAPLIYFAQGYLLQALHQFQLRQDMPIDGLTDPHLPPTIVHLHESRRVSGQITQAGGETRMGQGPVLGGQSRRVSGQIPQAGGETRMG